MKKIKIKSKGAILVCVVAIILIGVMLVGGRDNVPVNNVDNGGNNAANSETNKPNNNATNNENAVVGEFVEQKADGSKVNKSEQLKTTKTVEGLELTNIRLVENGGLSEIMADAKNTTNKEIDELTMIITVLDKDGNKIAELQASVFDVGAGKTTTLRAGITDDISNAYDFTVRKK